MSRHQHHHCHWYFRLCLRKNITQKKNNLAPQAKNLTVSLHLQRRRRKFGWFSLPFRRRRQFFRQFSFNLSAAGEFFDPFNFSAAGENLDDFLFLPGAAGNFFESFLSTSAPPAKFLIPSTLAPQTKIWMFFSSRRRRQKFFLTVFL